MVRKVHIFLAGKPKGKIPHLRRLGVDGRVVLKYKKFWEELIAYCP
jgi:hypothetical protein